MTVVFQTGQKRSWMELNVKSGQINVIDRVLVLVMLLSDAAETQVSNITGLVKTVMSVWKSRFDFIHVWYSL